MNKYLFKIALVPENAFSRFYGKIIKPIYVVAEEKEDAAQMISEKLKEGLKIRSISRLAVQLAGSIFSGNIK